MKRKSILLLIFVGTLVLFTTLDSKAQIIDPSMRTKVLIPGTEIREIPSSSGLHYLAYVHLPPDYYTTEKCYPVLFLTDAESEVFGMYTGIYNMLSYGNEIRELIIVGIADGGTAPQHHILRKRDYTFHDSPNIKFDSSMVSGGGGEFLRFLQKEFIPFIEREYRTDPSLRGYWGYSLGGLFGAFAMFQTPNLFNSYILSSPSLWWDEDIIFSLEQEYAKTHKDLAAKVYISVGTAEFTSMKQGNFRLVDSLNARGYPSLKIINTQMDGGSHFSAMPRIFEQGILALYGKVPIGEELLSIISEEGIEAAVARYHTVVATDPDGYQLGMNELNRLGYDLLGKKKFKEAITIFQLNVEAFPKSWGVYDSLAEGYMMAGDKEKAISNYQQSLELDPNNANNEYAREMLRKLGVKKQE
ncbi:MAG TPA: alpha/beta hydrolase-fold protein [Flavobacteriaceae bacterium]|nr:alpha/beta hydrolase-fold protein [Flavobacteriaceae bacterium]